MLVRVLVQTSLVLWLAQLTLQGGVKPQSVSWGRVLPARGVGVGVKPGVAGALGALGSRYGTKAMKSGIGRYPGAQLGLGGYRALGLGGRAGLKQGGYGAQGAYGAALGAGMGTGLTNGLGLGLGLGHAGKRAYGAGLGTLPGYGALAGIGYPGARPGTGLGYPTGQKAQEQRPGVSAADLGGPQMAHVGQTVQDLKREKSRALGPMTTLDKPSKGLGLAVSQGGGSYEPTLLERSHGASLAAGGARQQLPLDKDIIRSSASSQVQSARDSSIRQNQRNCGSTRDVSDVLGINHHELLGSEIQRTQGLVLQPHVDKASKHLGPASPQVQGERTNQQPQDGRSKVLSVPQGQRTRGYLPADGQGGRDLVAKDKNRPRIRGTFSVEHRGSLDLQAQRGGSYGPVIPGGSQSLGIASVEGQEAKRFTADGQKVKELSPPEGLVVPGQTDQATSYLGGAGNYLGAGGYGAGLGQGAYLGGAAGKLGAALGQGGFPLGAAGTSPGYGDGATGYLGAMAGNGYGYGNGYSDGLGAGLGYPSELADGAENKAGKREALSTGGYAGQVQGAYGGLDSAGGKYGGGAAQVPYGNAPVIPAGLEGDGGYPYPAQQLNLAAEGAKTANKYGAAAGYGAQQTGYGAQLGAAQDALGDQAGKYGAVNRALGNEYKG